MGLEFLLVLALLGAAVLVISAPLRRSHDADRAGEEAESAAADVAALEAAREAKYREIREAELDLRTGKVGEEDHRVLDRELRAQAVEILKALDRARERGGD